jgi:hypothetical protein
MKTTLDEYIRTSFVEATRRAIDALADLARYSQSGSPPFSQVHGLQRYIDELKSELTLEEAIQKARGAREHILMDVTLQSDAWDGAPTETVSEAREAWKDFMRYLKLARKSVLADPSRTLTYREPKPSTLSDEPTPKTIHFKRSIGEVYYRTIGQKRWRKWKDAKEEVTLFSGHQYQLRVSPSTLPFRSPKDILAEVDLDVFEEIVIPARISSRDYYEQATSGRFWIEGFLEKVREEYQQELKCRKLGSILQT